MIMANDTRSRRSWMNSFTSIAQVLRQKPLPLEAARRLRGNADASLEIILRLAHQIDEHVLQRRLGALPGQIAALAVGAIAASSAARLAAGDMQAGAERRHHVDARSPGEFVGKLAQPVAGRR